MTPRLHAEDGFTLIELLVVILIVGILAAIALPAFLAQGTKSEDAAAKTNVRNAVTQIDACYTATQSFEQCDEAAELTSLGVPIGSRDDYAGADCNPPLKGICVNSRSNEYRVIGRSASDNLYQIDHVDNSRTCQVVDVEHAGGCATGGSGLTGVW